MKKKNTGLKEGILINITILLISALVLLGFALVKITESILIKQQSSTAYSSISSIQSSITYAHQTKPDLSFSDLLRSPALHRLLRNYIGGNGFKFLKIIDRDIGIIFSSESSLHPSKFSPDDITLSLLQDETKVHIKNKGTPFWFLDDKSSLEIYSPIFIDNEIKGGIIGNMPLSHVKLELTKMKGMGFIFIAVDAIVFILFGRYLLSKGVIHPIKNLMKATEAISGGSFPRQIENGEYHEINTLAKSFNQMTQRLKEKTENLKETIVKLKKSNTQLQTTQEGLIRSEKLAAIGQLAAGLAHEIGNPLGSITAYLDYLMKGNKIEKSQDCLERVQKEVSRIDEIVREFLDLASPPRKIISSVEIKKTITNTINFIKHRKKFKNIKIIQNITDKIPNIKLDEQKFRQVLINLLLNAADAVNEKGIINITSEILGVENKMLISISDNGSGIEKKDFPRIFDPFFTTKESGKGTGLGLSICQKIITNMQGEITVESILAEGTKVNIFLPLV